MGVKLYYKKKRELKSKVHGGEEKLHQISHPDPLLV
jgi:hypothetical protein